MVDHNKSTGSSGTMTIKVFATTVEFWIEAGSSTFAYQMPWAYVVNGTTSSWREFRFESGGAPQKVATFTVTTSQTVTFKLGDTGTSGLGGPTNFSVAVNRATEPDAPTKPVISSITSSSVVVTFSDGSNNGDAIDTRQIAYGLSSTTGDDFITSDGSTSITGLLSGRVYYFWARTHNSEGWSPWSARASATTLAPPGATSAVSFANVAQTSVDASFTTNANGGATITGRQIGYGTSSTTPSTIISSDGSTTITGLQPATTYYFWSRAQNSVGFGPWSARSSVRTIAGAWLKVGTVWKEAVPYVKVAGVWRVARPWGRTLGTWKESL